MRILVTGGSRGIGFGIASHLLSYGDEVVIVGRNKASVKKAAGELQCEGIVCDITGDISKLFKTGFDGLVNSAGIFEQAPLGTWTKKNWQSIFELDLLAPALLSQAFAKQFKGKRGSIVNIVSTLAFYPDFNCGPYASVKAGLVGLTKSLALELAPKNISVNAIAPGIVETELVKKGGKNLARLKKMHALGKLGRPQDIAEAVFGLLHSEWTTGSVVTVDGGLSLGSSVVL